MNKIEFKNLDKEQMIIAFNQLKDDYHALFEKHEQLKEVIEESKKFVDEMLNNEPANSREYDYYCGKLAEILDKVQGDK